MKGKNLIAFLLSIVIIAASLFVAVVGIGPNKVGSAKDINLGLDLAGGVSITYQTSVANPTDQQIKDTIYKLQQRISQMGYTEGEVYKEGSNRINVDIPNVSDPNAVLEKLGEPGDLKFALADGTVVISGGDVKNATVGKSNDGIGYIVQLELNTSGKAKFAKATSENIGKPIYIIYNGETIMAPRVQTAITDGIASITGIDKVDEASSLATYIRIGALPLKLEELRSNVVGAKMGQDAINTSVTAAIIGMILIFAFMMVMYRIPGVMASVALCFYAAIMILSLNLFGITLTLPGIAGMILSVGMAVDANVIIFSRLKEELGAGKTLKASIKSAFKKATSAIIDGNVTTIIAAVVLFLMGTGTIKGFAETLFMGTVISMFTALVVTRILLTNVALALPNKALYGSYKTPKVFQIVEKRRVWFSISLIVVVIGLVFLPLNGGSKGTSLNYDIEFAGGTSTLVTTDTVMYNNLEELQTGIKDTVVKATGDETPQMNIVQGVEGQGQFVIKTKTLTTQEGMALRDALVEKLGITNDSIESESISPTVSGEMRRDAIIAVLISAVCMLVYITIRFKDITFGISAVVALLHDVLIVFTIYSVLFIPINNSFIAAMLTIVGYSINDTIVLFDRIREDQKMMKRGDYKGLINLGISQTLTRSINTSLTTFVMVFILNLLGVASIREFALPLMVGILSGTYSSIFIASPLWYLFKKKDEMKNKKVTAKTAKA